MRSKKRWNLSVLEEILISLTSSSNIDDCSLRKEPACERAQARVPTCASAFLRVFISGNQRPVHAQSWKVSIKWGFTSHKCPSNRATARESVNYSLRRALEWGYNSKKMYLHVLWTGFWTLACSLKQICTIYMCTSVLFVCLYRFVQDTLVSAHVNLVIQDLSDYNNKWDHFCLFKWLILNNTHSRSGIEFISS